MRGEQENGKKKEESKAGQWEWGITLRQTLEACVKAMTASGGKMVRKSKNTKGECPMSTASAAFPRGFVSWNN